MVMSAASERTRLSKRTALTALVRQRVMHIHSRQSARICLCLHMAF